MPEFNDLLTEAEIAAVADDAADDAAVETPAEVAEDAVEAPSAPASVLETVPEVTAPEPIPPLSVDAGLYQQASTVLDQIEARLVALEKRYEDGDLSFQQFRGEERTLLRHQREAEGVLMQAQIEQRVAQQATQREWNTAVSAFRMEAGNEAFENPVVLPMMQSVLEDLRAKQPGLSAKEQLSQAKQVVQSQLRGLLGLPQDAVLTPKSQAARPSIKPPPVLSVVPLADNNSISEFSGLDRLTGIEYETALGKLTPEQQQRYLAA